MADVRNSENRFGGEYLIQDCDHLGANVQGSERTNRSVARQADQSQRGGRQQGGDQADGGQQGAERRLSR